MTQTRRQFAYPAHLRNLVAVAAAIADGDMPTAPELAALVGVDERTIYRYLTTLRWWVGSYFAVCCFLWIRVRQVSNHNFKLRSVISPMAVKNAGQRSQNSALTLKPGGGFWFRIIVCFLSEHFKESPCSRYSTSY